MVREVLSEKEAFKLKSDKKRKARRQPVKTPGKYKLSIGNSWCKDPQVRMSFRGSKQRGGRDKVRSVCRAR